MTGRLLVFDIPMDCLLRLLAMRTSRCRLELLVLVDMWSEEGAWGRLVEVTLKIGRWKWLQRLVMQEVPFSGRGQVQIGSGSFQASIAQFHFSTVGQSKSDSKMG